MINNDNDNSQNQLVRYFCGTSIPAMSMISREISWWDISVVEMIQVIQVLQLIQDNQVRLARESTFELFTLSRPILHVLPQFSSYPNIYQEKDTFTKKQPKNYVQHAKSGSYFGYLYCWFRALDRIPTRDVFLDI